MFLNPLELRGPEFLFFYFIAGVFVVLFLRVRWKQQEARFPIPRLDLTDPYEIAYLRGGENEALRIATLSLIDRGLLMADHDSLCARYTEASQQVRRPIEKALLRKFRTPQQANEMFKDESLKTACYVYRTSLGRHRLIASESVYSSRLPLFLAGLLILIGLAGWKIANALSHGRTNIEFLVGMAAGFTVYLTRIFKRERTCLGDRFLSDLENLFAGLKDRTYKMKAGGETNEAALLAAVFGISALSPAIFPHAEKLFPKASSSSPLGDSSGCGTSCGSSCGGGCGSGCGGCGS